VDGVEHQLEFYPSMFKHPVAVAPGLLSTLTQAAQPEAVQQSTAVVVPRATGQSQLVRQEAEAERSCSGSTGGDQDHHHNHNHNHNKNQNQNPVEAAASVTAINGAAGGCAGTQASNPPRTKADLIRLMEATSEEMQRAKSLLLGYQEASRQHGVLVGSPRGQQRAPTLGSTRGCPGSPKMDQCGSPRAQTTVLSHASVEACHSTSTVGPSIGADGGRPVDGHPYLKALSTVMSSTHISPRAQTAVIAAPEHATTPVQPKSECTSA